METRCFSNVTLGELFQLYDKIEPLPSAGSSSSPSLSGQEKVREVMNFLTQRKCSHLDGALKEFEGFSVVPECWFPILYLFIPSKGRQYVTTYGMLRELVKIDSTSYKVLEVKFKGEMKKKKEFGERYENYLTTRDPGLLQRWEKVQVAEVLNWMEQGWDGVREMAKIGHRMIIGVLMNRPCLDSRIFINNFKARNGFKDWFTPMLSRYLDLDMFNVSRELYVEEKVDGERVLIHYERDAPGGPQTKFVSRNGKPKGIDIKIPSFILTNSGGAEISSFILDGELSGLLPGKNRPVAFNKIHDFNIDPVIFIFDILMIGGRYLMEKPLEVRKMYLTNLFKNQESKYFKLHPWKVISSKPELTALFENAGKQKMEGLVVKVPRSQYNITGERSGDWVKFKVNHVGDNLDLLVVGLVLKTGNTERPNKNNIESFICAYFNDLANEGLKKRVISICKIGNNATSKEALEKLMSYFEPEDLTPFSSDSAVNVNVDYLMYKPDFVVDITRKMLVFEVTGHEITFNHDHYSIRFPKLLGVRADKDQLTDVLSLTQLLDRNITNEEELESHYMPKSLKPTGSEDSTVRQDKQKRRNKTQHARPKRARTVVNNDTMYFPLKPVAETGIFKDLRFVLVGIKQSMQNLVRTQIPENGGEIISFNEFLTQLRRSEGLDSTEFDGYRVIADRFSPDVGVYLNETIETKPAIHTSVYVKESVIQGKVLGNEEYLQGGSGTSSYQFSQETFQLFRDSDSNFNVSQGTLDDGPVSEGNEAIFDYTRFKSFCFMDRKFYIAPNLKMENPLILNYVRFGNGVFVRSIEDCDVVLVGENDENNTKGYQNKIVKSLDWVMNEYKK